MKSTLVLFAASALLAAAGPAAAEEPAPAKPPERPAKAAPRLNLKLDEGSSAAPRITFGPRDPSADKAASDNLPTLGVDLPAADGKPRSRPIVPSSPYPPDTAPYN
jgi:hypothetical protein